MFADVWICMDLGSPASFSRYSAGDGSGEAFSVGGGDAWPGGVLGVLAVALPPLSAAIRIRYLMINHFDFAIPTCRGWAIGSGRAWLAQADQSSCALTPCSSIQSSSSAAAAAASAAAAIKYIHTNPVNRYNGGGPALSVAHIPSSPHQGSTASRSHDSP